MSDTEEIIETEVIKKSKMPLILGIVALLLGAGGGFYATFSGMILSVESPEIAEIEKEAQQVAPDISFLEIDPMVVSLRPGSTNKHLSFRAQLEVPNEHKASVELLMPRIVDVLNGYLRALETKDLEHPTILLRLRSQMLRRINIVVGEGHVNDFLIMEFVLN